ncbi:MAG: hypothetical protein U1F68_06175 [Gammaproteobacteria bacterium]
MESELSTKNTKNEILDAYNALLKRVKEQKPVDRQADKEKAEKVQVVESAARTSVEKIVKGLAEQKLTLTQSLDEVEEQLIGEFKKLKDIRQAIEIERKNLEEIHEIRAEADSLAVLLQVQKEKKQAFEAEVVQDRDDFDAEMAQKKLAWKKEQEDYERTKKERDEATKKARQREEEEYAYDLQLQRKKDQDTYAAKKAALEKELEEKRQALERNWSEREAALTTRETELADLRARVESFPKDLDKAIKDTEKTITERLQFKFKHEAEILAKDNEGERKLSQQIIASLQAKIKEQDDLIRQLTQKANEAGLQVQNIAVKAIEGASAWRAFGATSHEKSGKSGESAP